MLALWSTMNLVKLSLLLVALAWASPARAQPDVYRGRTINLLVGPGEGGGFDLGARLVAQFLPRFIQGNPTIVVQNMPGASGLRVAEYMSNIAPRDGSVIAVTQPSIVQHKVLNAAARFNPAEYAWLGRLGGFVTFAVVWHTAPAQSVEEAKRRELILGAVGPSGPGAMLPAALNALAGTRFTIVKGYKSAAEMGLAVERGEIHGSGSASYEYVSSKGWLERKLARMLFTIGLARSRPMRAGKTSCGWRRAPPRSAVPSSPRPARRRSASRSCARPSPACCRTRSSSPSRAGADSRSSPCRRTGSCRSWRMT